MARLENKTRAGLVPEQENPEFKFTTSDVEAYFNRELNHLTNGAVTCEVNTVDIGNKTYRPFIVALPVSVIVENKNKNESKKKGNGVSLTNLGRRNGSSAVRLNSVVYKFFSAYMFNKKALDDSWRHEFGLSRTEADQFKSMCSPKRFSRKGNNKHNEEVIVIALNPMIVLWDMVGAVDDPSPYSISVKKIKKISTGEYEYTVVRSRNKNRKDFSQSLANELNLCINPYSRNRRR